MAARTAATHGCAAVLGGDSALSILRLPKRCLGGLPRGNVWTAAQSANAVDREPCSSQPEAQQRKKVIFSLFPHIRFNPGPEDATDYPTDGRLSPRPPGRRGSKALRMTYHRFSRQHSSRNFQIEVHRTNPKSARCRKLQPGWLRPGPIDRVTDLPEARRVLGPLARSGLLASDLGFWALIQGSLPPSA